jgi:Flp pilus assembly protein TadG
MTSTQVKCFLRDNRATTAIEFGITAPAFFVVLFAIVECGFMLWTQFGLQHGVEMSARCASVNATLCGTPTAIQNYAAQQAFGLSLPSSTFSVSTPSCGNQVAASYAFPMLTSYFGSVTLTARSCFPK